MKVRVHEINEGKKLYYIENKNIKTVIMWIMYYMPLDEKASLNALLPRVLIRGSGNYNTTSDITKYLYSNYGATLGADINLKGEIYTMGFYTNFVNNKLLPEGKNILKNMAGFLEEILYNPLIDESGFREDILKIERENLINSIRGKSDNKDAYAFDKCIELMCRNEPYGIDKLGKAEWVSEITNRGLFERYNEIVSNAPCNIYVMGDLNFDEFKGIFESSFLRNRAQIFSTDNINTLNNEVREYKEILDTAQSKICMGFRTGTNLKDEDFPSLVVFNKIFGGGPESRLFMRLREEQGLCYNVFSIVEKFKGLIFAACGVEPVNAKRAIEEITGVFEEIQQGNFHEEEFNMYVNSCIKDYEDIKNDNYSYISFLQGLNVYNCSYGLEDLILKLRKVKKKEVIECSKKIKLDTIFLLEGR